MKYLLDTNVLSEAVKTPPNKSVMKMLERHQHEIVTAAPVWHELQQCYRSQCVVHGSAVSVQIAKSDFLSASLSANPEPLNPES